MKFIKRIFLTLIVVACSLSSQAQVYFLTRDVVKNTKYVRKKQEAHSIKSAFLENDNLIINFTATLNRRSKRQPHHITLSLDSVLSYYRDKPSFSYVFDSFARRQYNVHMLDTRYGDLPGGRSGGTVEIMCMGTIIDSGFYTAGAQASDVSSVEIIDGKDELYTISSQSGIYLKGKHIVFLYKLPQPYNAKAGGIDYVVINIENGPKVNKWNYMKLPYTVVLDTAMLPFVLLMSGMEK